MRQLLLEIGLEEIPAGFMPRILKDMASLAEATFRDLRLDVSAVHTSGTPRRLVLRAQVQGERQLALSEKLRGPSEKVAYKDGEATKALTGFMRGNGLNADDVFVEDGYVYGMKKEEGRSVEDVLPEALRSIILGLHFPKTMRWGSWQMRYVRPLHWVVALLDDQVVPLSLEVVSSGRVSKGHRVLGDDHIEIPNVDLYDDLMRDNYVIVDANRRRDMISEQMHALVREVGGELVEDASLLEEVVHLVEYPTALMGRFDESFLEMPESLVITPMKEHQRYFPVRDAKDGRLINGFITVRNGTDEHLDLVRAGNERVLAARLADARFFYHEDLKINPETWLEKLKQVVFQEQLGTIYDKVMRIEALAGNMAQQLEVDENTRRTASRAAHLSKADLVSNVVAEFPELQGVMGEVYVGAWGDDGLKVAQAVREHYMPVASGEDIAQSEAGRIVAIADKMDTIVGCFAVGIEPTGSQDPYALRRQAAGVLHTLIGANWSMPITALVDLAIKGYPEDIVGDAQALRQRIYGFFEQRVRTLLKDGGYGPVFIEAMIRAGYDKPLKVLENADAVTEYMNGNADCFNQLLTTYKRAHNLSQKATSVTVKPDYFEAEEEKNLYKQLCQVLVEGWREQNAIEKLTHLYHLDEAVNALFDSVMIMAEKEAVRDNRLSLLRLYTDITADVVDLSAL